MYIKTNQRKYMWLWLIPWVTNGIINFQRDPENRLYHISVAVIAIIMYIFLTYYWKEKGILFKSNDTGIIVSGSKEGIYDPDYIAYSDISNCVIDQKRIVISLISGEKTILVNLGKHLQLIYDEIQRNLT